MDGSSLVCADKAKILASRDQYTERLLSNDQMRDHINEARQAEDSTHYGNGFAGDEENRHGYLKGIKRVVCLGSGFVGGLYNRTTSHELAASDSL